MEDDDDIGVSIHRTQRRDATHVFALEAATAAAVLRRARALMCHDIRRTPFAVGRARPRAAAAPSVGQDSGPGEERHEIGILMDCAILLAEIKAGALSLGSL